MRRFAAFRISGISAVLLSVLAASEASAEPRKPTHIACIGDSITYGSNGSDPGPNGTTSYPSRLQGLEGNGVVVKNFGHSGATMLSNGDVPYIKQGEYTGATDFVDNAGADAVVSVVIILGANDSKDFNWNRDATNQGPQYLKDYLAMVDHFAALKTKPTVYVTFPVWAGPKACCSIRGNIIHDEQIPLIKQVAMQKHLPIIDLNTPFTNHSDWLTDDVHPNDNGYVQMAGFVKMGLEREPSVSITAPLANAMVPGGMIALTADAAADAVDISSVEFFEGATSLGKATTAPYSVMWASPAGMHQVTAKAIDATLANATSMPVSFTVLAPPTGGAGGASGASGSGGAGGSSSPVAGGSGGAAAAGQAGMAGAGAGGMPAAGGTASAGAAGSSGSSSDAGCSCRFGSVPSASGAGLLGLAALGMLARRRRR